MKKSTKRPMKTADQPQELSTLFAELKAEYIETFAEKIEQIEKLWQQYNRKDIEMEFHKIKGTGATYGVKEATQVAEVMEDICHQGSAQLGTCILFSLEILKKIRAQYKEGAAYEISKDPTFKFLRARQDELESA